MYIVHIPYIYIYNSTYLKKTKKLHTYLPHAASASPRRSHAMLHLSCFTVGQLFQGHLGCENKQLAVSLQKPRRIQGDWLVGWKTDLLLIDRAMAPILGKNGDFGWLVG